jgi:type I restriction enzyme S subunit
MVTLGDLTGTSQYGWTTRAADQGRIRFLRTTDITRGPIRWDAVPFCAEEPPDLERYRLSDRDLVVSRAGSVGASALMGRDLPVAVFASYLIRFRMSACINPRYVAFFLQSPEYWRQIADSAAGIALQNVNAKKLAAIALPLAPRAEQERIVAAIDEASSKLDAGEAGLRTARQLLKRMQDAIIVAAVSGRLVPRTRGDVPTTDSPSDWTRLRIGDLAEVTSGPAFKSADFGGPNEGIRLLRGENIEPGALRWRDTRTWPERLLPGYEHLFVASTDIILAMDRPVISTGLKLARVRSDDLPALLVQRVARIRPRSNDLVEFIWLVVQTPRFLAHILQGQVGTQLPHITLRDIRDFDVLLPPPEDRELIVASAVRQLSDLEACERAVDAGLARAAALRRSVLKAAFEGRLVPQDPSDEPVPVLLDRIRAERAAAGATTRRRGARSRLEAS